MIETQTTLAELAVRIPSASRVFYRHGLDFCCHGNRPFGAACEERGLTASTVLEEIESENRGSVESIRWERRPKSELISHIINYYHRRLREELPALVEMAAKVETAHRDKASRPQGLAAHLEYVHAA